MSNQKLLSKILRLKELKITGFEFKDRGKELHVGVKPYKNGCCCRQCQRRCPITRQVTARRSWADVTILGLKIVLWYFPKEIHCQAHGKAQEEIPWAAPLSRVTYRLEFMICNMSQIMTQKAAAGILTMAASTLSDVLHRVITRVRAGHKIRGLVTLGVDEISYLKGRKFCTIVYDLDRSCVLWVGQGKGRATIDRFFNEQTQCRPASADQMGKLRYESRLHGGDQCEIRTASVFAHPLAERLQQRRLRIGGIGQSDHRCIHALRMSQEQPSAGQDIYTICARVPTTTTSREMSAETFKNPIVHLAHGQVASGRPANNVFR